MTDEKGLFSVTKVAGKNFGVTELTKPGYVEMKASNRDSFEYAGFWEPSYHQPDETNPVVFHVRKKAQAEPMVHHGPTLFSVPNDGTPAYLDVSQGRKVPEGQGDIRLRVTKGEKINKRFNWTATVEAINGAGIIALADELIGAAPLDGYQTTWSMAHRANDEDFTPNGEAKLFVRTGQSKFGRIEMRIIPEYNELGAVDLEIFFNPSGSTNLEYDPGNVAATAAP